MRYKKGSKVEVFCKDKVPSGSWCPAEVICGNGHNYTVKCDMGAKNEAIFERVSKKLIRPLPPPVQFSGNWMLGDVVEVFHGYSWKMATVSKVLSGNQFLVRLVGSLNEFKVRKFDIRLRQAWLDDKWVLVGKGSENFDDQKCSERPSMEYKRKSGSSMAIKAKLVTHEEKEHVDTEHIINFQEYHIVSGKTLKRGFRSCYPQAKAHESMQKFRAIEKDGRRHRVTVVDPSSVAERVENCAYSKKIQGEKEIYSLLNNRTAHFSEMDVDRIRMNGVVGYSQSRSLECNDTDDVTSSVGSHGLGCYNLVEWPSRILAQPVEYAEDHSSDAESVCPLHNKEVNYLCSNEEELAAEIHRLEMHAYRCTMEALHASGPLSWEQETLITNLRISLHISNDEHLMELKNLISNANSIPVG
ncbi:hypothetical protein ACH5RR_005898 [Cinchona calisaya]|uniref:ENT domain-containing protein n=1 Tax=Cinchona calisaya TaxID=153742 RepID=A0ABD3AMM1_9GENT